MNHERCNPTFDHSVDIDNPLELCLFEAYCALELDIECGASQSADVPL